MRPALPKEKRLAKKIGEAHRTGPLENELARDLQLPRRSAIAGSKARRRDLPKARRRRAARRLPKVRMVEDVECISPQLEGKPLGKLRILLARQVYVGKTRPEDLVA